MCNWCLPFLDVCFFFLGGGRIERRQDDEKTTATTDRVIARDKTEYNIVIDFFVLGRSFVCQCQSIHALHVYRQRLVAFFVCFLLCVLCTVICITELLRVSQPTSQPLDSFTVIFATTTRIDYFYIKQTKLVYSFDLGSIRSVSGCVCVCVFARMHL